jgi:O-antigen ligase
VVKNIPVFAVFLTLVLFSYQYKFSYSFISEWNVPFFLGLCLNLSALKILYDQTSIEKTIGFYGFSLFCLWVVVSFGLQTSNPYSFSKFILFLLFTVPSFYWGYLIVGPSVRRSEQTLCFFLIFTLVISILAFLHLTFVGSLHVFMGNNYLVLGQSIGLAILLLQTAIFQHHKPFYMSLGVGLMLGLMLYNPGRGPLVALCLSLCVCYGIYLKTLGFKKLFLHFVCVVLGMGVFYCVESFGAQASAEGVMRLVYGALTPQADGPLQERWEYMQKAWDVFKSAPLTGAGFGLWPKRAGYGEAFLHPHNVILEIMSELGFLGLVSFVVVSVMCVRHSFKNKGAYLIGFKLLGVFSALNALKSGDLNDNILFFFCLGCLCCPSPHTEKGMKPFKTALNPL